ncbi:MAG: hypothetical protein QM658_11350 [Gordonia sp. (in: high G+C Gram-positive bacteria)]
MTDRGYLPITREQYIDAQQAGLNSGPFDTCPDYPHPLLKMAWRTGPRQVTDERRTAMLARMKARYPWMTHYGDTPR